MSVYFNPEIVTDSLICAYDLSNLKSYGGTGSSVTDMTSTMGTGTLNSFAYNSFAGGTAFLGSNSVTGGISMSLTNFSKTVGSIEIWAYPTSWNQANGLFINRADNTANATDWLWIGPYDFGNTFYFRLGTTAGCCNYDNAVGSWASSYHPVNTWGHYVCTWMTSGQSRFYFNGVLLNSVNLPALTTTNPSSTGLFGNGHEYGTNSCWNGYLGPMRIYNTELTASQVYQNFSANRQKYGR
jgi:hypothetical protein